MPTGKILITEKSDPLLAEGLTDLGFECHYSPGITQADVEGTIHDYTGLIVATRVVVNRRVIDSARQLKFIARAGSGMENIDVPYAGKAGIVCINSPEGNANSVGEHALAMLLAFYHNIVKCNEALQKHQWPVESNRVHELEGRTIGIIGYGNTGQAFAKKLQPMGMKVLTYDKYKSGYSDQYAMESGMEQLFEEAEIVSLHIPLTAETTLMVDRQFLERFRKKIFLINTARGKLIMHSALWQLINEGKLTGAALDVFENENFSTHSAEEHQVFEGLLRTGKVIFTPHVAGKSHESPAKIACILIARIAALG